MKDCLSNINFPTQSLQWNKNMELLLDVETTFGQGVYHPELKEPDFSNASSTAMWELTALMVIFPPLC